MLPLNFIHINTRHKELERVVSSINGVKQSEVRKTHVLYVGATVEFTTKYTEELQVLPPPPPTAHNPRPKAHSGPGHLLVGSSPSLPRLWWEGGVFVVVLRWWCRRQQDRRQQGRRQQGDTRPGKPTSKTLKSTAEHRREDTAPSYFNINLRIYLV